MQTKSDQVRQLVAQEQYREAIKIASKFKLGLSKEQRATIVRAHESYTYPHFQKQLGRDPHTCIMLGVATLVEIYGGV